MNPKHSPQDMQQMQGSSSQSQAPNIGAIMDNTYQIIRDGYSIRHCSRFPSRHPCRKLLSCDFSSDGKIVASGGETAKKHGAKPFICNVESLDSVTTSESHSSTIFDVRFQPGSTIFATSSADKTIKFWDVKTPKRALFGFGFDGIVRSLDFHPTERILCSSDSHDGIQVWDLHKRAKIDNCRAEGGCQVRFQPGSGKLLAVANQNVVTILEFPSLVVKYRLQGHAKDINSVCWDFTGQMIAAASEDYVCAWSLLRDGECISGYPSKGNRFMSIAFHPRYHDVLVIGGLQCMELLIPDIEQVLSKSVLDSSITGLAACTQNELITSIDNDFDLNIWK